MTAPRAAAVVTTANYLWLQLRLGDHESLDLLRNVAVTSTPILETLDVEVGEEDGSQLSVTVGARSARVRDGRAATEYAYGAVHDRVLEHAREQGWLRLHLAVVEVAGRRVGLAGPSGAGKSTTVLALALRGGTVHGDEVAFVRDGSTIALPRPMHLKHGTMAMYPWLSERSTRLDYEPPVHVVDPAAIDAAAPVQTVAPLDAIFLLDGVRADRARCEPASVGDGLRVFSADAAAFNADHGEVARTLAELLDRTPVFRLHPGTPDDTARAIAAAVGAS
jgi:ribosomal protein S11